MDSSLNLATVSVGGRPYTVSADTYEFEAPATSPRRASLGRVGGLVRKKREKAKSAPSSPPGSRLTFTLRSRWK